MPLVFKFIKLIQPLFVGFWILYQLLCRNLFPELDSLLLLFLLLLFFFRQLGPLHHILCISTPLSGGYWQL